MCAGLYVKLREHGFISSGVDGNGHIKWGIDLKRQLQQLFDGKHQLEMLISAEIGRMKARIRVQYDDFCDG